MHWLGGEQGLFHPDKFGLKKEQFILNSAKNNNAVGKAERQSFHTHKSQTGIDPRYPACAAKII